MNTQFWAEVQELSNPVPFSTQESAWLKNAAKP